VCIRSYVPHAAVLPYATLMITHAGMGSLLEAFRAGVPTLCLPLGRDQDANAAAAVERGAAVALAATATSTEMRRAIAEALRSTALRGGARHMARALARCGGGRPPLTRWNEWQVKRDLSRRACHRAPRRRRRVRIVPVMPLGIAR